MTNPNGPIPHVGAPIGRPILNVGELSFSYAGRHVLTLWSAGFAAGVSQVAGRNGSGKSTLLKLLAGALRPLTGRLAITAAEGDIDAARRPLDYRREVFWCGPGPLPFDHLRPPEYFGFMRGLYPAFDSQALDRHVEGFGLADALQAPLRSLSTGTQRKVWLAAALAAGTRVTLLDEPFNALDAASLAHLRQALAACAAQPDRAWIVVSHEPLGNAVAVAAVVDLSAQNRCVPNALETP